MLKSELCEGLLTVKIEQLNQSNLINHKPPQTHQSRVAVVHLNF